MAKGRKLRIARTNDDADPGPETFTPVAGAREDSFTLTVGQIDLSDKDDEEVRVLTEGGMKSISLSVSGVAKTDDMLIAADSGAIENYELTRENGTKIVGPFQIASYEGTGPYEDSETFSCSLESAGAFTITPAA